MEVSNPADNKTKIKALEDKLKQAYSDKRFSEVKTLASEVKSLDPKNHLAQRLLEKVTEAEKEANRKIHAEEINKLQDQIERAFKAGRFDEMGHFCESLSGVDPENKIVKKFKDKVTKAKEALAKKKIEAAKPKKPSLLTRFRKWLEERRALAKIKKETAKPVVAVPREKPKNIFEKLASKVDKLKKEPLVQPATKLSPEPAAAPVKPVISPVISTAQSYKQMPKVPSEPAPTHKTLTSQQRHAVTPAKPQEEKGNIFTKMFGKKEVIKEAPTPSIIETIVSKTNLQAPKLKTERVKEANGAALIKFSGAFLQFALVFILISAGFFYAQNIDAENRIFGLFGIEDNYAMRLHNAAQILEEKKEEEQTLSREIKRYDEGYNNQYEEIIRQLVEKRLNWPDVLKKINEVVNSVYERNDLSQYIQLNSFSFDFEKGLVRVSGTLSDPLGKNLTKLAELEEAFNYFPDKENPYFYEVKEFSSLQKSLDKRTGKYTSSFQLSFTLQPEK